ncbi:hypothetical protein [Pseudonocardia oroxyli]|uniref:Uncharacterized protein n=1 Tax=Pseudonocardia oroxyli TaxID=366584 RepID=A0A1G7SY14_PSEOR|nr:hypothetical protein [Pseudonocardia oroxyli]SDG27200.1 hypothetical protein SAMN05216377_110116 [Pseudonocardia oroxyli]
MGKANRLRKQRQMCVFCGTRPADSKEHTWGKWTQQVLPDPTEQLSHTHMTTSFPTLVDGRTVQVAEFRRQNGAIRAHRQRIVCSPCNNGWMSALETSAKTILKPMMFGEPRALSPSDQASLALWADKTAMVNEFGHRPSVTVSADQRRDLYQQQPAPHTRVWLARFHDTHANLHSLRNGLTVFPRDGVNPGPNLRTDTFLVGRVLFHVLGASDDIAAQFVEMDITRPNAKFQLIQIWPAAQEAVSWPPSGEDWTDSAFDLLARMAKEELDSALPPGEFTTAEAIGLPTE